MPTLVPALLPISTAAALSGRSPACIRGWIAERTLDTLPHGSREYVLTASLEHVLGRRITAKDYLLADQRQEPVREAARSRASARRASTPARSTLHA